jgi:hypothetical protein
MILDPQELNTRLTGYQIIKGGEAVRVLPLSATVHALEGMINTSGDDLGVFTSMKNHSYGTEARIRWVQPPST